MQYNPDIHHRHTIRLNHYNYSKNGMYYITICTKDRRNLFCDIVNKKIILNEYGKIVECEILKTNEINKNVKIINHIIMPNHIHMIMRIYNTQCTALNAKNTDMWKKSKMIIPKTIQQLKAIISKKAKCSIWQRNYYEYIIRNTEELNKIRKYIQDNPQNWEHDKENTNSALL